MQMETRVRKQSKLRSKETKHERQDIHSLVEMGHHALACGSISLGWGEKWLNRDGGEGVGGLRGKGVLRNPQAA